MHRLAGGGRICSVLSAFNSTACTLGLWGVLSGHWHASFSTACSYEGPFPRAKYVFQFHKMLLMCGGGTWNQQCVQLIFLLPIMFSMQRFYSVNPAAVDTPFSKWSKDISHNWLKRHMFCIILILKTGCDKIHGNCHWVNTWVSDFVLQFIQPIVALWYTSGYYHQFNHYAHMCM